MRSPAFQGKGLERWWAGVVPPAIPPFPPPPYPAVGMVYPPPPAYPGVPPPAPVRQHPHAGGAAWGAQEGKGEEHRRAWERVGEEGRRLGDSKARVMGGAARVAEGWITGQGTPRGGEAQAVEELQRALADLRRMLQRVERAEEEGERQREHAQESGHSSSRPSRRKRRGECRRGPGGSSEVRQRGRRGWSWKWQRGRAGCRRRRGW